MKLDLALLVSFFAFGCASSASAGAVVDTDGIRAEANHMPGEGHLS